MARYTVSDGQVLVEGKKLDNAQNPVIGAYVQVVGYPSGIVLGFTTTDERGYWGVTFSEATLLAIPSVQYQVRFVGSGLKKGTPPTGDWEELQIITSATGPVGPGVVYRGEYDEYTIYYYTTARRDIVKHGGIYHLCSVDGATGPWNEAQWSDFGATFSSVATDILLAQDVNITKTLVLGSLDGTFGIIRTANADGLLSGDGVWLEDTADGFGRFRVGTTLAGLLTKGVLWDGTDFSVMAENVEITSSGNLWAVAGGFGGTSDNPKLHLSGDGLYLKDDNDIPRVYFEVTPVGLRDADGWRVPSVSTELITNGEFVADTDWTHFHDPSYGAVTIAGGICTLGAVMTGYAGVYQAVSTGIVANKTHNLSFTYITYSSFGGSLKVEIIQNAVALKSVTLYPSPSSSVTINETFTTTDATPVTVKFTYTCNGNPMGINIALDHVSLKAYEYFADLNQNGLYVYNSPVSYVKIGRGIAEFKGATAEYDTLVVKDNFINYGKTYSAADDLGGTTSPLFTVGTETAAGATIYRFGNYATTNEFESDGSVISSSVPFNAPVLTSNEVVVATSYDLDMEMMKLNFQQVSWAQFAIQDNFADSSLRDPITPGDAVIEYNALTNGGDQTLNKSFTFNSKTYTNITDVYTGVGIGSLNAFTDSAATWFTNEVKGLKLIDADSGIFDIISNTDTILTVSGTPKTSSAPYILYDQDPTYIMGFMSFEASTYGGYGEVKFEFSCDDGGSWLTILDTFNSINRLSGVLKLSTYGITPDNDYKVKITLTNDSLGRGPKVHRFLIATDPSPWRW
jgi:hypothetical protein